jgi:catechol 2,3-dioxygenase-like lactoylglutathione lyase family enzyme
MRPNVLELYRILIWAAAFSKPLGLTAEDKPYFHHVHLNVVNPDETIAFYKTYFSGVPVKFHDVADAILTDRSWILLTPVDQPAPWKMESAIYHIGWGGVDGPSEFEWRDKLGIEWETPLRSLGNNHYMYAYGPDREVVEIWTGFRHNRFGHVHLFAEDVEASVNWYVERLGVNGPKRIPPKPPPAPADFDPSDPANAAARYRYLWASSFNTENGVTINVFAKPSEETLNWWNYDGIGELVPTDGRAIDHLAFSYRDIAPVLERMSAAGVEIVKPIAYHPEYRMKSFFVRGPDKILIEIVEARPFPEGLWDHLDADGNVGR